MSELRTSISCADSPGLSWPGRKTRAEMISEYRAHAERLAAEAAAILSTPDDEFEVSQHRGAWVRHDVKILPPDEGKVVGRG